MSVLIPEKEYLKYRFLGLGSLRFLARLLNRLITTSWLAVRSRERHEMCERSRGGGDSKRGGGGRRDVYPESHGEYDGTGDWHVIGLYDWVCLLADTSCPGHFLQWAVLILYLYTSPWVISYDLEIL